VASWRSGVSPPLLPANADGGIDGAQGPSKWPAPSRCGARGRLQGRRPAGRARSHSLARGKHGLGALDCDRELVFPVTKTRQTGGQCASLTRADRRGSRYCGLIGAERSWRRGKNHECGQTGGGGPFAAPAVTDSTAGQHHLGAKSLDIKALAGRIRCAYKTDIPALEDALICSRDAVRISSRHCTTPASSPVLHAMVPRCSRCTETAAGQFCKTKHQSSIHPAGAVLTTFSIAVIRSKANAYWSNNAVPRAENVFTNTDRSR
jgi:hypothetical protein